MLLNSLVSLSMEGGYFNLIISGTACYTMLGLVQYHAGLNLRHTKINYNQFGSVKNFIQLLKKNTKSNVPNSKVKKKSAMKNCILSFCQTFCLRRVAVVQRLRQKTQDQEVLGSIPHYGDHFYSSIHLDQSLEHKLCKNSNLALLHML